MGHEGIGASIVRKEDRRFITGQGNYTDDIQVKHATYGSLTGDPAVFKVLRWTGGNFQINFEGKTNQQSTSLNTQGLLMEGLRLLDEAKRDAGGQSEEEEDVLLDS